MIAKRIAAQHTLYGQPAAFGSAVPTAGFLSIMRAAWFKPASRAKPWRQAELV
jgi:hypothetical protein